MSIWKRSESWRVTVSDPSRVSTLAGIPRQATIWYVAIADGSAAHVLAQQRDVVPCPDLRVELMADPQHGVVDQHLDVLADLRSVPERGPQLGEASRQPHQHRAHGGAFSERLREDLPPGAVASGELGDPAHDLDFDHSERAR